MEWALVVLWVQGSAEPYLLPPAIWAAQGRVD
jgi:hypothetical protein